MLRIVIIAVLAAIILSLYYRKTTLPTNPPETSVQNGSEMDNIQYKLPPNWTAEVKDGVLVFSANGGYLSVREIGNYKGTGRREFYCEVSKNSCINETEFNAMRLGNILGYKAEPVDNSGSSIAYFGAKGDKFYIVDYWNFSSTYDTDFQKGYMQVIDSLQF